MGASKTMTLRELLEGYLGKCVSVEYSRWREASGYLVGVGDSFILIREDDENEVLINIEKIVTIRTIRCATYGLDEDEA